MLAIPVCFWSPSIRGAIGPDQKGIAIASIASTRGDESGAD
jgi:hypothetical protein